ncbi:uncharacterized protein LOC107997874 isoform X1 [Apis cerana]|uniref:uncharacterized protein LOC107997874 isoform X1 n=1 Tax=Apis cerana TaxID=7461 RepID=UPI0007E2BAEB|nr:uncharacterized protein LOC107997874 isoform X1 [Apis cerana]
MLYSTHSTHADSKALTAEAYVVIPVLGDRYLTTYTEEKRYQHLDALKKMLTPGRSGPISPEEIGNGPDTKDPGATGNGSGTYARGTRAPTTYETDERAKEFLSTGRTGRRNALTEILSHHAETGILDLPDRFEELTMETGQTNNSNQDSNSPGTSKQQG